MVPTKLTEPSIWPSGSLAGLERNFAASPGPMQVSGLDLASALCQILDRHRRIEFEQLRVPARTAVPAHPEIRVMAGGRVVAFRRATEELAMAKVDVLAIEMLGALRALHERTVG